MNRKDTHIEGACWLSHRLWEPGQSKRQYRVILEMDGERQDINVGSYQAGLILVRAIRNGLTNRKSGRN